MKSPEKEHRIHFVQEKYTVTAQYKHFYDLRVNCTIYFDGIWYGDTLSLGKVQGILILSRKMCGSRTIDFYDYRLNYSIYFDEIWYGNTFSLGKGQGILHRGKKDTFYPGKYTVPAQ